MSEEDGQLVALDWGWGRDQAATELLVETAARLQRYFDGHAVGFDDLPMQPMGSAYCRSVWSTLRRIPRGQTRSYAAIAGLAGGSARSVGQANGRNPLPVLIPCHRVTAARGIGGYSAPGGTAVKRHLLALECAGT